MTTPFFGLSEIAEGVQSQSVLHNQALRQFEARGFRVLSRTTDTPATGAAESDSYILRVTASGVWASKTNQIASWIGGAWSYFTPPEGVSVWVNDENVTVTFDSSSWVVTGGTTVSDAMLFKGSTDCSGNPNYPAANKGDTYRVSVAGKVGGASGIVVEVGDLVICLDNSTSSGDQATVGSHWTAVQANLVGAVIGPASVTDGHIAVFDGTTGKLIKDSGVPVAGTGDVVGPGSATDGHIALFDGTTGKLIKNGGAPATGTTITVASGAKALATGAISSGAATSAQTDTATGVASTDTIIATFNGNPTGVTGYIPSTSGMLTILAYPTADTVNFIVSNNTGASITPGAITVNWRVVR